MTRRRPELPFAPLSMLTTIVLGIAVVALLVGLRRTAPHEPLEFVLPAAADPEELLTCERTVPGDPQQEQREEVAEEQADQERATEPIGRITSSRVVECPDVFDQELVTFVGEVVGDVLEREHGRWLLVNDDAYALEKGPLPTHTDIVGGNTGLAVWAPDDVGGELIAGGPGRRGDIVVLQGILHRTDPNDGGGLTIRARDLDVVEPAQPTHRPFHGNQAIAAGVLAVVAMGTVTLQRIQLRRR